MKRIRSSQWRRTVETPQPAGGIAASLVPLAGLGCLAMVIASQLTAWSLSPATWYIARASGMTLYLLLWLSVVLGLGMTTQLLDRTIGRHVVYSLHDYATQLSYGFLALHFISLAADPYSAFTARQMLVPFQTGWNEPWTGFGVIAAYLLLVIGLSFGMRRITGFRVWRWLHMLAFPLYVMALAHGIGAGTDTSSRPAVWLYVATAGIVFAMTVTRIAGGGRRTTLDAPAPVPPFDRMARMPGQTRA